MSIQPESSIETEFDLGTVTDPNAVKTELSVSTKPPAEKKGRGRPPTKIKLITKKEKIEKNEESHPPEPEMQGPEDEDPEDGDDNDWCAVCHDGGDTLYCCDRCPKVYHLFCYIPPLTEEPPDDWVTNFNSTF